MLKVKFVSNCLFENVDDIKLAALYFDQIEVVNHSLYIVEPVDKGNPLNAGGIGVIKEIKEFVTADFKGHLKILEDNNILKIIETEKKSDFEKKISDRTNKLINDAIQFLFEETDVVVNEQGKKVSSRVSINPEAIDIHSLFVNPIELGGKLDLGFLFKYYSGLLSSLLYSMAVGEQSITSSEILNNFIKYNYKIGETISSNTNIRGQKDIGPRLAIEAIKVALPDVSKFSVEEILEIRYKLNDELLSFRDEMDKMQIDLLSNFDSRFIHLHINEIVTAKIKPSIEDLKRKLTTSKIDISQKLVSDLKDPKSYTPLIGTLFNQIPLHLAAILSAGIIGASSALDYVKSMNEIKENGLYYLIKLNKKR